MENLKRIGLDINTLDKAGSTIFGIIIKNPFISKVEGKIEEILSLLLTHGATPTGNSLGYTLLKYQGALGDQTYMNAVLRIILLLIQHGARSDERDDLLLKKSAKEIAQEIVEQEMFNRESVAMRAGLLKIIDKRFGKHCLTIPSQR